MDCLPQEPGRRVEKQRQRPIEWTNHQSDAIRLSIDLGSMPALPKGLRNHDIYRLHPLFQLGFAKAAVPTGAIISKTFS